MTTDLTAHKRGLRRQIRAGLKALTADERREASASACALLRSEPLWREAQTILFYASAPEEIDLTDLVEEALAAGKTAALPGFVAATGLYEAFVVKHFKNDCAPGKFGLAEPKQGSSPLPLNRLDLVLVPGLGFDLTGHRLGRGQGFYDRLLAHLTAVKCGVAFDLQIVERLPAEAHDVRMNCLLTPTRWRQLPP